MNRIPALLAAGVATIAMLAVPTFAAGATPKKGGSYEGTLYANSGLAVSKKVVIKVLATGTRARTTFWCGSSRPANWISFAIRRTAASRRSATPGASPSGRSLAARHPRKGSRRSAPERDLRRKGRPLHRARCLSDPDAPSRCGGSGRALFATFSGITLPVDDPLVCAECGCQSPPVAAGWRAYLDDDGQAVTLCPECAEREFGVDSGRPGTRTDGVVSWVPGRKAVREIPAGEAGDRIFS